MTSIKYDNGVCTVVSECEDDKDTLFEAVMVCIAAYNGIAAEVEKPLPAAAFYGLVLQLDRSIKDSDAATKVHVNGDMVKSIADFLNRKKDGQQ